MKSSLMRILDVVVFDGEEYKINTDFKVWIEIEGLLLDNRCEAQIRLAKIFSLAYPVLPPDPIDAVQGIMWFYSCGDDSLGRKKCDNKIKNPCYDLSEDFDYIWGAFMSQYGIDLIVTDMHWWRFKALLACLDDNCKFLKIVGFRQLDTASIKDRQLRQFYEKMKKQFRLKGQTDEQSAEEALVDAFAELF